MATITFSEAQAKAARFFAANAESDFDVESIRYNVTGWGEFDFYADGTAEDLATGEVL